MYKCEVKQTYWKIDLHLYFGITNRKHHLALKQKNESQTFSFPQGQITKNSLYQKRQSLPYELSAFNCPSKTHHPFIPCNFPLSSVVKQNFTTIVSKPPLPTLLFILSQLTPTLHLTHFR